MAGLFINVNYIVVPIFLMLRDGDNTLKNIFKTEDIDSIRNNPKYCVSEVIISSFKNYEELGNNPYEF